MATNDKSSTCIEMLFVPFFKMLKVNDMTTSNGLQLTSSMLIINVIVSSKIYFNDPKKYYDSKFHIKDKNENSKFHLYLFRKMKVTVLICLGLFVGSTFACVIYSIRNCC